MGVFSDLIENNGCGYFRRHRFVRACAIESNIDMSQEASSAKFRERKYCPLVPRPAFYASLRSRNAHVRKSIGKMQGALEVKTTMKLYSYNPT